MSDLRFLILPVFKLSRAGYSSKRMKSKLLSQHLHIHIHAMKSIKRDQVGYGANLIFFAITPFLPFTCDLGTSGE